MTALDAITQRDGAVIAGDYATEAACNRARRDEQERQDTLGTGGVVYLTEPQYQALWDEFRRLSMDGSADLFTLAMTAINRVGELELHAEQMQTELDRRKEREKHLTQLALFGGATDAQPVAMSTNARTKG